MEPTSVVGFLVFVGVVYFIGTKAGWWTAFWDKDE